MRKLICILLCLLLCPLAQAEDFGQSYKAFVASYAENIIFINDNTGRHLLPHTPSRDYDTQGKRLYRIQNGALNVEIRLDDLDEQIASCQITLTAPSNMRYGDAAHNNFSISGYHSYALLMSIVKAETAYERYALVTQVNEGLAAGGGACQLQVGDYQLTCTSQNGSAVLLFENALLLSTEEPILPAEDDAPAEENDEESFVG